MPHGPQKLILIRSGRYDYAEVELRGSLQIVGPNNTGKTTLINTLQFLYLDDRRQMDFGAYAADQTRDYYFSNQYSYVLFECLGARGLCVLGWRGQNKAAGGDPERFYFEGPFDAADFLDKNNQVREPAAVNARLSLKQYNVLKSAQEHRELLLLPTRGEGRGLGLVALRDNDKYPQFRDTLKNLLYLSTITQEQMRDRLLMLADLPTNRYALDVRELFGEDYDRITRLKSKLIRFKKHQAQVEALADAYARRDALRGELIYRWTDLRGKRQTFEQGHEDRLKMLQSQMQAAIEQGQLNAAELADRRMDERHFLEAKGGIKIRLDQFAQMAKEFTDFVEDFIRAGVRNVEIEISTLEHQLADAAKESREKTEDKIQLYRKLVDDRRKNVTHFDRALITVLRHDLNDEELAPLARLFNFDLLSQPVGADGIHIIRRKEFVSLLRLLHQRIQGEIYRDSNVEIPLPPGRHSIRELADLEAVRGRLADDEQTLHRAEQILKAITEREILIGELRKKRNDADQLRARILRWEQFQIAKADEPRLKEELKETEGDLDTVSRRIAKLEKQAGEVRDAQELARKLKVEEENRFNAVMGRFNTCLFPEFPGKPLAPTEATPDDFDGSVSLYLHAQQKLGELDQKLVEQFRLVETALGSDYIGSEELDTIRLLREELEALPDREDVLRRDWEHHLTHMRGVFDQVLKAAGDIRSAAERLNRRLGAIHISNLRSLRMEVIDQADLVGSLRKLANIEQPGLFDDSAGLEAALGAFRQKFEANPLLQYSDLFTLRFTVTGDDGKPHYYHDFRQVESHGTTITIKVLFNLLVLRSLLREDASKSLLCEVPFFLDEIHSLDPVNRHAILETARKLGFIAITAAPSSIGEVDALYFLQAREGRIVLRNRHRIGVKTRRGNV
jgi:hypothetical protein